MCTVEVALVDQNIGEHAIAILLGPEDLSVMWTIVAFTSEKLTLDRRYSLTVVASNVNGSATSSGGISKWLHYVVCISKYIDFRLCCTSDKMESTFPQCLFL